MSYTDEIKALKNHGHSMAAVMQISATRVAMKADAEIARLREALTHIAEYWNRSENDTAMNDALFHMIETAEAALAQESGE